MEHDPITWPAGRRPAVVVSACLCGVACNHEGEAAKRDVRAELEGRYRVIPVCPEVLGGLPTPRPAAEIQGGTGAGVVAGGVAGGVAGPAGVMNVAGEDVTAEYRRGAEAAVAVARGAGATRAVLKARSPSCGSRRIYDGTFSRTLVDGEGVTAAVMRAAGIEVSSEEDPLP